MSLLIQQQIFEIIKRKERVLIVFAKNFNGDSLASALGLSLFLKKLEKDVTLVCDGFEAPIKFKFLPMVSEVKNKFKISRKFTIGLDISKTKMENLSYQIKDEKLEIYINPLEGVFSKEDVSFSDSEFRYDLIFVLDTADLESLGKVYEDNVDFFYQTPIVNIDHSAENENFGQINLVDLTANATSEIIFSLLENNLNILDEDLATALYTGIVAKTQSFKSSKVTPKTLNIAAQLISAGARRDEIIKNLFQTYSLLSLKLWGRALARLKEEFDGQLVWTVISQEDFIKTAAGEEHLQGVAEELILTLPNVEVIVLIYQGKEDVISVLVYTKKNVDAREIVSSFKPLGDKNQSKFTLIGKNLREVEEETINLIKNNLQEILAI